MPGNVEDYQFFYYYALFTMWITSRAMRANSFCNKGV